MGLCLANQSRLSDAVPYYLGVLRFLAAGKVPAEYVERMEEVHLRLGNCYRSLGGGEQDPARRDAYLAKARRSIEEFVRLRPAKAIGHFWLGTLLFEEYERPYEALEAFRKAYALDPVCDGSLRSLIQIVTHHPPPPGVEAATWAAWREAWRKDLEENAEKRAKERRKREDERPDGTDGCA
jgi:tetratricopeptide (TPR) repeat protein